MMFRHFRPGHRLEAVVAVACIISIAWVWRFQTKLHDAGDDLENSDVKYLRPIVKSQLANELVSGRRSLFEVAVLFERLDAVPPEHVNALFQDSGPMKSSEERQCRCVILWCEYILDENDHRLASTRRQLNEELQRAMAAPGGIRFPATKPEESAECLLAAARASLVDIRVDHNPQKRPDGGVNRRSRSPAGGVPVN